MGRGVEVKKMFKAIALGHVCSKWCKVRNCTLQKTYRRPSVRYNLVS